MPENDRQILSTVLEHLPTPALLVQGKTISYCNPTATALTFRTGEPVSALLGDAAPFYESYNGDGTIALSVRRDDAAYSAAIHRQCGMDIFLITPPTDAEVRSRLLATISQTLREPISSLFHTASTLFPSLEELENANVQAKTSSLSRNFYQLLRIAGNLSDAAQMLSGTAALFPEPTDLTAFFGTLSRQCQPLVRSAGRTLVLDCADTVGTLAIDQQKIERAVLNLISNSLKFTAKGGEIRLHVERTASSVLIRVQDNGEGMDADAMASAFTRYTHPAMLGDPRRGIGLGLALVRRIAELHQGTVALTSMPQRGTCVTMSLSLHAPAGVSNLHSPILNYDYTGGQRHALVELADAIPIEMFDSVMHL